MTVFVAMNNPESGPNTLSLAFVEGMFADFLKDPEAVPPEWCQYFEKEAAEGKFPKRSSLQPALAGGGLLRSSSTPGGNGKRSVQSSEIAHLQDSVDQLVRSYRVRGHLMAQIDPLGLPRPVPPELDPATYGLTEKDMDRTFSTNTILGPDSLTLREIIQRLRTAYCRSIGVQFMHIDDFEMKVWLQERIEGSESRLELDRDQQIRILTRLTDAVIFEQFLQRKYQGAKSFSLEGAESLIPLLDMAIEKAGEQDVNEIVIGMAHRGRLNVLANIMGKSPREIFSEFEGSEPEAYSGGGDVKYHRGYHNDWMTSSGRDVHLALCFNPSHLEFVDPVAMGRVRAKQDRLHDEARDRYILLLIHGDAAFAGEGIVQETLNLSMLHAYSVGGTIHVVLNNQIGFTTPPSQARSGVYCTDIARMLQSPVFHVNGEDPEAVAQVVNLAMDFRQRFKRDVVIDMYCYRRRGHNESDEPSFTQPLLYSVISHRESVREGYLHHLLKKGGITRQQADEIAGARRAMLEKELQDLHEEKEPAPQRSKPSILGRVWKKYCGGPESDVPEADTRIDRDWLATLLELQTRLPRDFHAHPKIQRLLEARRKMAQGEMPLDWAAAEAMAFASIAAEGARVRLTGQDCERGTFSHRHAVLHDVENGKTYVPLQNLVHDQAPVEIVNSPLCEAGVLGFEYGYSMAYPDALICWEAQFGDFWNVAQVIVDQFIASAEDKWHSLSGIVLLLPHGFEGMGPEHSSARLERFLLMAAQDNIQVADPTTPAQFFHLLRRQVLRPWRKPLVVMTPKSLLRHPAVVSTLDELADGEFQRILPDSIQNRSKPPERVLVCSGRIYYDLEKEREDHGRQQECAILRVEQLYPLPEALMEQALSPYPKGTNVIWVQEEPDNMGAWRYLRARYPGAILGKWPLTGICRREAASPATGYGPSHKMELEELIHRAIGASA